MSDLSFGAMTSKEVRNNQDSTSTNPESTPSTKTVETKETETTEKTEKVKDEPDSTKVEVTVEK